METRYNGKLTKFMIYENHFKCIIPKYDAVLTTIIKGKKLVNGKVVDAEEEVNWLQTDEKNGVTIGFEVKKHNYGAFMNAVKDQLLYFKEDLRFFKHTTLFGNVEEEEIDMFSNILLESDSFIISDNRRFTTPHILINKVNYGLIDCLELDINKLKGNIALKAVASDVDVTASRESIKYTDKTKKFVLAAIEKASVEAGNLLDTKLASIVNPIDRLIQSRVKADGNNNSGVLKELLLFSGEAKLKIPIDITPYCDAGVRKDYNIKDTVDITDVMKFFFNNSTLITVTREYSSIVADKIMTIARMKESADIYYRIGSQVKLKAKEVLYLDKDLQYLTYNVTDLKKPDLPLDDSASAKHNYKLSYKYYTLRVVYDKILRNIIQTFYTDIESLNQDAIETNFKASGLEKDFAITVSSSNELNEKSKERYALKVKSKADKDREYLAKLKKEKVILPYKYIVPYLAYSDGNLINERSRSYLINRQAEIRSDDMLDMDTGPVIYGFKADEPLLKLYSIILASHKNYSKTARIGEDTSIVYVAKQNAKFYKVLKNSIHVGDLFKGDVKVEDNVLKVKSHERIYKFMTYYRAMQVIENHAEFYSISQVSKSIRSSMIHRMRERGYDTDIVTLNTLLSLFDEFTYVHSGSNLMENLHSSFDSIVGESGVSKSILNSLVDLTKVQEAGTIENIEDERLKANMKSFSSFNFEVYDRDFIADLPILLTKFSTLYVLLCVLHYTSISGNNKELSDKAKAHTESEIEAFFNNLKQ